MEFGRGSLELCKNEFCKKFRDKTRNEWHNDILNSFVHHKGKYDLIKVDYTADGDGADGNEGQGSGSGAGDNTPAPVRTGVSVCVCICLISCLCVCLMLTAEDPELTRIARAFMPKRRFVPSGVKVAGARQVSDGADFRCAAFDRRRGGDGA